MNTSQKYMFYGIMSVGFFIWYKRNGKRTSQEANLRSELNNGNYAGIGEWRDD